jgi:hypothetical protein
MARRKRSKAKKDEECDNDARLEASFLEKAFYTFAFKTRLGG